MSDNESDHWNRSFDAPPTLVAAVIDYIKNAILRGDYLPGEALPEIPLSQRVASSRSTVREALRVLSEVGLVVLHPRRGARVAEMSPKSAWELFTLRAVLESFAIRLALTEGRIGVSEFGHINTTFEQLRASVDAGDPFAMIEADMDFHWALCEPCGHQILLEQLRGLQTRMRQFIFYTKFYDSDAESEVVAHMPILTAVRALEADRAAEAVRAHITNAGERLLVRMLDQQSEPTKIASRQPRSSPLATSRESLLGGKP